LYDKKYQCEANSRLYESSFGAYEFQGDSLIIRKCL
jgi:hypothetical protein